MQGTIGSEVEVGGGEPGDDEAEPGEGRGESGGGKGEDGELVEWTEDNELLYYTEEVEDKEGGLVIFFLSFSNCI